MADDTPPMTVLRPGDRVLISFSRDTDLRHGVPNPAELQDHFPDIEFVVLVGPSVIVQPASQVQREQIERDIEIISGVWVKNSYDTSPDDIEGALRAQLEENAT